MALLAILAIAATLYRSTTAVEQGAALAVGTIRSTDSTAPSPVLRDMLATSLGGIRELSVVDNSRLVELMPKSGDAPGAILDAARRAGAGEIFEGEMVAVPGGFRLNLRRVSLNTGVVQHGYAVFAADPARLVDSATAAIARDLGVQSPTRSVTTTRTASPAAYALYEQGLRALYSGDGATAHALMRAALEHDSTFAMAAYYGWVASLRSPVDRDRDMLEVARRLAPRTIDRERLLIAGAVAHFDSSVATTVAIAETLAVRYPADPEAQILLGQALENRGDFGPAVAAYDRAVALDSVAGAAAGPYCRLCSALRDLSRTYMWWDSLDASVRTARRNLALRPQEAGGWLDQAEPLFRLGRRAEALAALDRRESMSSPNSQSRELLHRDLIRWGEFEEVDRRLIADLDNPSPDVRGASRWLLLISLRNQGRFREAKALAWDRIIPGTRPGRRHRDRNRAPDAPRHGLRRARRDGPGDERSRGTDPAPDHVARYPRPARHLVPDSRGDGDGFRRRYLWGAPHGRFGGARGPAEQFRARPAAASFPAGAGPAARRAPRRGGRGIPAGSVFPDRRLHPGQLRDGALPGPPRPRHRGHCGAASRRSAAGWTGAIHT